MMTAKRRWRGRLRVLVAVLALLLSACGKQPEVSTHRLFVLGTLVDISIAGVPDEQAGDAVHAVEQELQRIHRDWHAWQPGALDDLNRGLARGETVAVDAELIALIRQASRLSRLSGGLFNPAIGGLIALWGFHSDEPPAGPPPTAALVTAAVTRAPTMADLVIEDHHVSSRNPALQLDFGAFAKGVAVDRAIAILRRHGIDNAIVNAGGDLRAIGRHGDRPWRIGIRHPSGTGVIASLQTRDDESVFTSGTYERYFDWQGRRYHHIIDPRSGYPASGVLSATVIDTEAASADAAATALLVAGPADWPEVARRMGIKEAMLIDTEMNIYATAAMARRLRLELDPAPTVIIKEP